MHSPFPFNAPARLVDHMRQAAEPGVINLGAGVPGLDALPFEALRRAAEAAFEEEGAALFSYQHPSGDPRLRALLGERLATRGVRGIGPDNLVTTTGCTQALHAILSVLIKPGDVVACEAPAYYGMLEILADAGARALPLPIRGGEGLDLDAAEAAFARWKPTCLVICTSLSNPTGATLPVPARERLVALCRQHGVRMVEDDIYSELLDAGAPPPCRAFDDGSVVSYVTSFSKTVSPGLRIGFCIPGTPEIEDALAALKCRQDIHSPVLTEAILRRFLAAGLFDPHLQRLRERNRRRRALALESIRGSFPAGSEVHAPEGGYMLWVRLPEQVEIRSVVARAKEEKVAFASGTGFYAVAEGGARPLPHVRLNCARGTEEELKRGVEILGKVVSTLAQA